MIPQIIIDTEWDNAIGKMQDLLLELNACPWWKFSKTKKIHKEIKDQQKIIQKLLKK